MIGTSASSSQIALASNTTRALHHATKRSATKASAFTRHRISSRSVRKNGAIKEPSDVTEKISSESSSSSAVGEATASEGADEVKRAPRPATLNRPVSEAAVSSNAALENLKAAGGANGTCTRLCVFCRLVMSVSGPPGSATREREREREGREIARLVRRKELEPPFLEQTSREKISPIFYPLFFGGGIFWEEGVFVCPFFLLFFERNSNTRLTKKNNTNPPPFLPYSISIRTQIVHHHFRSLHSLVSG